MRSRSTTAVLCVAALLALSASVHATEIYVDTSFQAGIAGVDGNFAAYVASNDYGDLWDAPPILGPFSSDTTFQGVYKYQAANDFGSTAGTYQTTPLPGDPTLGVRYLHFQGSVGVDIANTGFSAYLKAENGGFKIYDWTTKSWYGGPTGKGMQVITTDLTHWLAGQYSWTDPGYLSSPPKAPILASKNPGVTGPDSSASPPFPAVTPRIWRAWGTQIPPFPFDADTAYFTAKIQLVDMPYPVTGIPLTADPGNQGGFSVETVRTTTGLGTQAQAAAALALRPNQSGYYAGDVSGTSTSDIVFTKAALDTPAGNSFNSPAGYMVGNQNGGNPANPDNLATYLAGYLRVPNDSAGMTPHYMTFAVTTEAGVTVQIGGNTAVNNIPILCSDSAQTTGNVAQLEFPAQATGSYAYWPIYVTYSHGNSATGGFEISAADGLLPVFDTGNFKLLGTDSNFPVYLNPSAVPAQSAMGGNSAGPRISALGDTASGKGFRVLTSPRGWNSNFIQNTGAAINYFQTATYDPKDPALSAVSKVIDYTDDSTGYTGGQFGNNLPIVGNNVGVGDTYYGTRISGLIYIPTAGTYGFTVGSDDGFQLRVGQNVLGSFYTTRGIANPTANYMYAKFDQPGLYPVALYSFQATAGDGIELAMKAPDASGNIPLIQASRSPVTNGYSVNFGGSAYEIQPVAKLARTFDGFHLGAQAFAYVPDLGNAKVGVESWTLSQRKTTGINPGLWGKYYFDNGTGGTSTMVQADGTLTPPNGTNIIFEGARPDFTTGTYYVPGNPAGRQANLTSTMPTGTHIADTSGLGITSMAPFLGPNYGQYFTAVFKGYITPPTTGTYNFTAAIDDQSWIFLDLNGDGVFGAGERGAANAAWNNTLNGMTLTGGKQYEIELIAHNVGGPGPGDFYWNGPAPIGGTNVNIASQYLSFDLGVEGADVYVPLAQGTGLIDDLTGDPFGLGEFPMNSNPELRLDVMLADQTAGDSEQFLFNPEPTTMLLLGAGLLALARRRRQKRAA